MSPSKPEPILGGPASVVETACPLDCPDACSLAVTVQHGKVLTIDGSHRNPVTGGFICAKVRKFGERVYGPDRLLYPAVRRGRKGQGVFNVEQLNPDPFMAELLVRGLPWVETVSYES